MISSIIGVARERELQRPMRCPLPCAVCGDQSTGFHYEVPSCNGCKTFFRRTVLDRRVFKCWKGGNCMLEKGYRCTCRACRFKKCVQAGMNLQAIQAPPKDVTKPFPTLKELLPPQATRPMVPEASPPPNSSSSGPPPLIQAFLVLEEEIDSFRMATLVPPTILLDELTRPSALVNRPRISDVRRSPFLVHIDIETFAILELAKAFNWFSQLRFTDKFSILGERTCSLLALRLSWYRAGSAFNDSLSAILSPLMTAIQSLQMDRASLSLLSALLLSESCNLSLTSEAKEVLLKQKNAYSSCLANHLLHKHGATSVSQVGQHFTLLWTSLHVAMKLKKYLRETQLPDCFTRQIIDSC